MGLSHMDEQAYVVNGISCLRVQGIDPPHTLTLSTLCLSSRSVCSTV